MMLSDVYLSVCRVQKYIGPKSRTERPRKTKIGIYVAHVTRDSDTTFKVKRSQVKVTRPLYSPLHLHIRQLQRWAWERVGREKLLLHCRLLGCMRRFGLGAYCGAVSKMTYAVSSGTLNSAIPYRPPTACFICC